MLSSLIALSFGTVLTDAIAIRSTCDVSFTVDGDISGPVGEISSGQVRAGDGVGSSSFQLQGDQLWDADGNGCWWTRKHWTLMKVIQRHDVC